MIEFSTLIFFNQDQPSVRSAVLEATRLSLEIRTVHCVLPAAFLNLKVLTNVLTVEQELSLQLKVGVQI